jgi:DNA-directed RNA polymerase subunit F
MIKDRALWEVSEAQYIVSEPPDFGRNLRIFEAMYEYARSLSRFPPADSLEGVESRIELARVLNGRKPSGHLIIHKILAGRPRDLEDARSILLKHTNLGLTYLRRWLKEFDRSMGEAFSDRFEEFYKSIGNSRQHDGLAD